MIERKVMVARKRSDLARAYKILSRSKVLAVDTETSGFSPHSCQLWGVQISDGEFSVLIPVNEGVDLKKSKLADLLRDESHIKVMHNAKFDLSFLRAAGVVVKDVYCSLVAERILTAGTKVPCGLQHVAKRYLNVDLSKEERKTFYDGSFQGWTDELVEYATNDVWVLPEIYRLQQQRVEAEDMQDVLLLEQQLVPVVARMEYLGVHIDVAEVRSFASEMRDSAANLREKVVAELEPLWSVRWRKEYAEQMKHWTEWEVPYLKLKREGTVAEFERNNKEVFKNGWSQKLEDELENPILTGEIRKRIRKVRKEERDAEWQRLKREHSSRHTVLISEHKKLKPYPSRPKEKEPINIDSNDQLAAAMSEGGVTLPNMKKETLQDFAGEYALLDLLLEYRKFEKLAQMSELDKLIDSATKRIHCNLNQCGTDTGRFSATNPL